MAKKTEPIVGIGNNPEALLVQKSRPLFGLWKSEFTLASFKLLDVYLARINSETPDKRTVVLEKGEIEKVLGVTKIDKKYLDERLTNLFRPVELSRDEKGKIHKVSLFEEVMAEQDENEIWKASLTCTPAARKYFFNIQDIGYLRYRLRSIVNITSRYSYIMFTYLESNRYRKSWEVDLDELKVILNCQQEETYKEYKFLNQKILQKCHKELTEKTELRYMYEPVKKGRKVIAIRFTVKTIDDLISKPDQDVIPGQVTIYDIEDGFDRTLSLLSGACNDEFGREEMELILAIISTKTLLPCAEGIDIARYHYLAKKYALLNLEAKKKKIGNRFKYFKTMLEKDVDES